MNLRLRTRFVRSNLPSPEKGWITFTLVRSADRSSFASFKLRFCVYPSHYQTGDFGWFLTDNHHKRSNRQNRRELSYLDRWMASRVGLEPTFRGP